MEYDNSGYDHPMGESGKAPYDYNNEQYNTWRNYQEERNSGYDAVKNSSDKDYWESENATHNYHTNNRNYYQKEDYPAKENYSNYDAQKSNYSAQYQNYGDMESTGQQDYSYSSKRGNYSKNSSQEASSNRPPQHKMYNQPPPYKPYSQPPPYKTYNQPPQQKNYNQENKFGTQQSQSFESAIGTGYGKWDQRNTRPGYNRGRGSGRRGGASLLLPNYSQNSGSSQNQHNASWNSSKDNQSDVYSRSQAFKGSGFDSKEAVHESEAGDENGSNRKPFPFKTFDEFGGRIKRKRNPNHKHMSVKKFVAPKNALMALMEAHAGLNFVEESVTVEAQGNIFSMSVEVNGVKFTGNGLSKDLAKHAAAEAALAGFVRGPGAGSNFTPWSSIASFAMYKLFNEWNCPLKSGREPQSDATNQVVIKEETPSTGATAMDTNQSPRKPAKQLPEGALAMNPVMLLHQMRPGITYQTAQQIVENGKPTFTLSTTLDGQTFSGQASNMKKAKLELAKEAVKGLFQIESTWAPTEPAVKN